jgi:hypothetical protein
METYTERIRIQNAHPHPLTIHIEPWGDQIPMAVDATYELVAQGPVGDCLLLAVEEGRLLVWGWSGSVMSVFCEEKLLCACDPPVPITPLRLSPK